MVHRALLGSIERFFGVLTEHYSGAFPVWLSPVQVELISVHGDYAEHVQSFANTLKKAGIRTHINIDGDRLGAKIRKAQLQKVPYMLVFGQNEIENNTITCRLRTGEQLDAMSQEDFLVFIQEKVKSKDTI